MRRVPDVVWALVALLVAAVAIPQHVWAQLPGFSFGSQACTFNTAIVTGTETSLVTSAPISTQGARTITLHGSVIVTPGQGATAVTVRIRRGSGTGGANVITPTAITPTAGGTAGYTFDVDDFPGEVAGQQYTITVQQTGASTNGTANTCELWYIAH